jgi:hypothetical protein
LHGKFNKKLIIKLNFEYVRQLQIRVKRIIVDKLGVDEYEVTKEASFTTL